MTNVSEHSQKTFEQLFCSKELTGTTHVQLTCLSVLNTLLSITAFLGNILILVALHKESSLHPPSKLLLRTLATTDACVGIVAEPLVVTYWMSVVKEHWNICRYAQASIYITGHILCSVSLLALTAIGGERLLALSLGPRYKQVVTLKRTYAVVILCWVLSIAVSAMYFVDYLITLRCGYIGALVCLLISLFSYSKIFLSLRHHHQQVQVLQNPPKQNNNLNIMRYRKAVSSALWLQLTLAICYLPYGIVGILIARMGLSPSIYLARQIALTLIFLNSSLNPILYCWKIREVRQSVKATITNLC